MASSTGASAPQNQPNMEEYSSNSFVNRGPAVPVIVFDDDNDHSEPASGTTTPDNNKKSKRERLKEHGFNLKGKLSGATRRSSDGGLSMQDRLMEK